MTHAPDRTRIEFPDISSRTWEHPSDRAALVTLRTLKGFDTVLRTLSGLLRERQHRLMYLATAVRVDERQFKDLNDLRADCVQIVGAEETPELFVVQSPIVNAFTIGMDRPFIVLTTGMLDIMTYEEQRFVVGHELGHALSGHAVYRTVLMHLMRLAGTVGWVPVGGWALRAVIAGLMEWQRKSELSGDRAGLLCGQDVHTAISVQLKLAGGARISEIDVDAFLAQAAEYEASGDLRDGVLKLLNLELLSHPFSVLRAAELKKWVDSGEYAAVLRGDYPRRSTDDEAKVSEEFRNAARTYKNNFDTSEDPLIKTVRDIGSGFTGAVDAVGNGIGDVASDIKGRFDHWRKS
ncbi:Zn-dependent protease [Rhodococcus sp. 05-2256-B2]|uniref:M48 family metallopeptidase n=1 Tax=Nocardiaceae TaxID=85025 RepID=UPI00050CE262|nr:MULTISPECIES: M48 family metallopeptidase [Rhodococcus]OZD89776.1 Zn-dependent protease [Rhodococcus sp. 05-2256-B4]OZD90191.1 Zn-dependent protease [Rhodococcus sp. 05-2256-B3]OZD95328.1 Zn-dependent protease [Rhodococcus sp. 05-2256-B2]OZE00195.1 Zn-dependent protease [Rhodococcus sp. 05-2256-B1]